MINIHGPCWDCIVIQPPPLQFSDTYNSPTTDAVPTVSGVEAKALTLDAVQVNITVMDQKTLIVRGCMT